MFYSKTFYWCLLDTCVICPSFLHPKFGKTFRDFVRITKNFNITEKTSQNDAT